MPSLHITPPFRKTIKKLSGEDQEKSVEAVELFFDFLMGKEVPRGLGYKKLAPDIFEFRVDIRLRIVGIVEEDQYYLYAVGSHDQVRRFLREKR